MINDNLTKSAILMLSLGEEEAAEVMKHLSPREVQKIGAAMSALKTVGHEDIDQVLSDFLGIASENSSLGLDSENYIKNVLNKALGEDKASNLLSRIIQERDSSGIESLKWMDAQSVAEFVKNEHPQIIATILVHLERDQASEILSFFTERLRTDVMLRVATLDGIKPTALKELNDVLSRVLSGGDNVRKQSLGGIRTAAEIMNFMGGEHESQVMDALRNYDEEVAQQVMDEMFVFDDIIEIDDRGIQTMLREVQGDMLILALKGATPELREKIFKNMSSRAAEMMREDLENRGPVKLSEVEAQQKLILQIVRRLSDEGQIMLGGKGGEDEYV